MMLYLLSKENEKESTKKKVWFTEDVKQPSEAGMMCTIDGDTFLCSQRIPGLKTQVHHAISPTTILANSIQGSFGIMPATRKGKL